MSFDGIVTKSLVDSFQVLLGAKINQINQPVAQDIEILFYNKGKNYKLLLSSSGNAARMYFIENTRKNPLTAPNFCMFLRKHIQNGRIIAIKQRGMDRIVHFDIKTYNEMGFETTKTLIIELMGRYSNIILVDENRIILDAIKKVTGDMSRIRQVLPGQKYVEMMDDKIDVIRENELPGERIDLKDNKTKIFQFFYRNYQGFSPVIGREICHRGKVESSKRLNELTKEEIQGLDQGFLTIREQIRRKEYQPQIILENNKFKEFHVLPLDYLGKEKKDFPDPSSMLEYYYNKNTQEDRIHQKVQNLTKIIQRIISRDAKKLNFMVEDYEKSKNRDQYKIYGDLLSSNVHRIAPGDREIQVENFYDENLEKITIKLDPTIKAWDNAQKYYKRYSKLKSTEKNLEKRIPRLRQEIQYLHQLLNTLEQVTEEEEVEEIREEMEENHLLKRKRHKKKRKRTKSKPYHFKTKNGADIYVGKNNRQNDELTLKKANREDYFFHAKDVPGSHVILRNEQINEQDILDAAFLAAHFSSRRKETLVEVDYTQKKNVNKAKGAKPGMVYYENFTTIAVENNRSLDEFQEI
ncbi:MAG: NFACT RNA binding domain-containing protein [Tissierellia bacterium]|nr:NFACT RNA binding domain-containing protein [Tissierellia bacterium]